MIPILENLDMACGPNALVLCPLWGFENSKDKNLDLGLFFLSSAIVFLISGRPKPIFFLFFPISGRRWGLYASRIAKHGFEKARVGGSGCINLCFEVSAITLSGPLNRLNAILLSLL